MSPVNRLSALDRVTLGTVYGLQPRIARQEDCFYLNCTAGALSHNLRD